jgi:hypothetical protein
MMNFQLLTGIFILLFLRGEVKSVKDLQQQRDKNKNTSGKAVIEINMDDEKESSPNRIATGGNREPQRENIGSSGTDGTSHGAVAGQKRSANQFEVRQAHPVGNRSIGRSQQGRETPGARRFVQMPTKGNTWGQS